MNLNEWAIRWGIPYHAVEDLKRLMGTMEDQPELKRPTNGLSEEAVQTLVRLEATKKKMRLWRNNVGAEITEDGRMIRYGLCNDSKKINQSIKSSDLIGIKPVIITKDMVGQKIGQFVAREVKKADWRFSNTAHERAQEKFLALVLSLGGDAAFCTREGTL